MDQTLKQEGEMMTYIGDVTVVGNLTADPKLVVFNDGGVMLDARVAVQWTRRDKDSDQWVEDDTRKTFYNIKGITGEYAKNAAESLKKGSRVVVTGRPCVERWTGTDRATGAPTSGVSNEIHARVLGVDLRFGTTVYTKTERAQQPQQPQVQYAQPQQPQVVQPQVQYAQPQQPQVVQPQVQYAQPQQPQVQYAQPQQPQVVQPQVIQMPAEQQPQQPQVVQMPAGQQPQGQADGADGWDAF